MPDSRLTSSKRRDALFEFAIAERETLVLAKMFRPGAHDKRLQIYVRLLDIAIDAPTKRAISSPRASVCLDGTQERFRVRGLHSILDGDEHRTLLESGNRAVNHGWETP